MNAETESEAVTKPPQGRMTWESAVKGPLSGATCLWQDLDGVHVEAPPADPPPTSILWAWSPDLLIRVRLDGANTYVAVRPNAGAIAVTPLSWHGDDGRVQQVRPAGGGSASDLLERRWSQIVDAQGDGTTNAVLAPVTFIRPAG